MSIPVNDLKRGFEIYQDEFENKAIEVLRSGWYILGNEVKKFEGEFSSVIGSKYCIGVDNGLNAISLGIKALGIGIGDEVIIQANTYIATVLGATMHGATPIFVEPTPYYNMDPKQIEQKITKKTKAILVTHLYGQATEMDKIVDICNRKDLYLLEDCAQSHFATYKEKTTGTFGIMGFFSFYPTKNIGAFGDGGAIVTDNYKVAEKIRILRNYGSVVRYQNDIEGYNSRLDEIQAGFLRIKLKHAKEITTERENIAKRYLNEIINSNVSLPKIAIGSSHVWHLFVVEVEDREKFRSFLAHHAISTDIHYPTPPHLTKAYKRLGYNKGDFPFTEMLSERIVSLPIFNGMTDGEIDKVIKVVNEYEHKKHYLIELKECGDERGGLAIIEAEKQFPFQIQRVFYEYNTINDIARGNHANINSSFGLVSVKGSCCVEVDDGHEKVQYQLDSPHKFLYIDKMIWKVMKDFTKDNVLLVISDQKYNEHEYVRDYEEFRNLINDQRF